MDKLNFYSSVISGIFNKYKKLSGNNTNSELEDVFVIDEASKSWLWLITGWAKEENMRVNTNNLYVRVKKDKIYIEEDWTEEGIATDLMREGVPKEDIVLAFHEPSMRKYTEFADI